jgi:hypothetical protein
LPITLPVLSNAVAKISTASRSAGIRKTHFSCSPGPVARLAVPTSAGFVIPVPVGQNQTSTLLRFAKEIMLRYLEVVQLSCIFGFICSIGAILVREKRNNQEQKTSNRGNPRELGKSQRISTSKDTSQKPTRR